MLREKYKDMQTIISHKEFFIRNNDKCTLPVLKMTDESKYFQGTCNLFIKENDYKDYTTTSTYYVFEINYIICSNKYPVEDDVLKEFDQSDFYVYYDIENLWRSFQNIFELLRQFNYDCNDDGKDYFDCIDHEFRDFMTNSIFREYYRSILNNTFKDIIPECLERDKITIKDISRDNLVFDHYHNRLFELIKMHNTTSYMFRFICDNGESLLVRSSNQNIPLLIADVMSIKDIIDCDKLDYIITPNERMILLNYDHGYNDAIIYSPKDNNLYFYRVIGKKDVYYSKYELLKIKRIKLYCAKGCYYDATNSFIHNVIFNPSVIHTTYDTNFRLKINTYEFMTLIDCYNQEYNKSFVIGKEISINDHINEEIIGDECKMESNKEVSVLRGPITIDAQSVMYCKPTFSLLAGMIPAETKFKRYLENAKVRFNKKKGTTCVIWPDGTKTIVKCAKDDKFDPEVGFVWAVTKKIMGDDFKHLMKSVDESYYEQVEYQKKKDQKKKEKKAKNKSK